MTYRLTALVVVLLLVGCEEPPAAAPPALPAMLRGNGLVANRYPPYASDNPWIFYPHPDAALSQPHNEFTARVVKIVSGDTIDVLTDDGKSIRIRLNGIDSPELDQPFGSDATEYLSNTIDGARVAILDHGPDIHGRTVGDVLSEAEFSAEGHLVSGTLVNLELVKRGLAWHEAQYSPDREDLERWQQKAQEQKLGLWDGRRKAVSPWEWKKMSEEEKDPQR